jgi:DNA-binding transcriptional LysR family regulator
VRIDFLGLEAFLHIAELGSFQQAAVRLNLSQTALSHRLKKLENDLGVALLTRTTRQVSLTPAGCEFLPKARRIVDELGASFDALRERGRRGQERLAIGCLPTLAASFLPAALAAFAGRHPGIQVVIHDNSAREILDLVQAGEAEFGLTIMASSVWDLEIAPLFTEPFVLLCRDDHPLAGHAQVDWARLGETPLVRLSPQAANRGLIDTALGGRRETLCWRYEVQHIATAVSLVRAGLGAAVVPRLAADPHSPGLAMVGLRAPGIARSLGVVSKRGVPLSPPARALLDLIRERGRSERSLSRASPVGGIGISEKNS